MSFLRSLPRSLFAQLLLLSLVMFIGLMIYTVFLPMREWVSEWDPLQVSWSRVVGEVYDALDSEYGDLDSLEELEGSEIIQEAIEINPGLRIYVEQGDRSWNIGGPPHWIDVIDIDHPDLVLPETGEDGQCDRPAYSSATFNDASGSGRVYTRRCHGQKTYIEVAGIENSLPSVDTWQSKYPPDLIWFQIKDQLITSAGIILIAFLVLGLALRSMMRVARVADSFDPENVESKLPEKGLPSEVQPLIHAINGMLDRVNESREQQAFFLATAAHEIRTPLAIMRARLETLSDNDLETKEDLRNDIRRLSRLVEDLLRLLSVRNRGEPEEEVDMVALARRVVEDRAPLAVSQGVDLGLDSEVEQLKMLGDERLLRVALSNLVDNALSFSENGSSVEVVIRAGGAVNVVDHGPGVAPELRASLFEPFAKNPPNRKGHGLGLAIVKAIINLHKGMVRIEDTPGGGATFAVQFP